jgi:hypothetical protein
MARHSEWGDTVRLWAMPTGRECARVEHWTSVRAIAISRDLKLGATASREYLKRSYPDAPGVVAFSEHLLPVTQSRTALIEPWRTEDLMNDLCARTTRNLTPAEWKQYVGGESYRCACPTLPYSESFAGVANE